MILFVLGTLFGIQWAAAASPDSLLSEYSIRRWRAEDGLKENVVNDVEQAPGGYLWCVTQKEAWRFDGLRFTSIDRAHWPAIPFLWRGVATGHDGALWLYGKGGVLRYDGREWFSFTTGEGNSQLSIQTMAEDSKGVMWGACREGLCRFDGSKRVVFPCKMGNDPALIVAMDVGLDGQIWGIAKVGTQNRLFRWREGIYSFEDLPLESGSEDVLAVQAGSSGKIWVATGQRLWCKAKGEWLRISLPEGQPDWSGIRNIFEAQGGDLWIGTARGLFRLRKARWSGLTTHDGIFPFAVRSLKDDGAGGLWIASTGGLMRLTPKALRVSEFGLKLNKEPIVSLLRSGSDWWVGIAGMPLLTGTLGEMKPADLEGFPANITASALLKAKDGALWVGTHSQNLWRFKDGKSKVIFPKEIAEAPNKAITALLEDKAGKIWVGTMSGLAVVTLDKLVPVRVGERYPTDAVNTLFEDGDGTIWVGFQTLGLASILPDGSSTLFQKGAILPDNSVRSIYRDSAGVLWIGTSAGLVRWTKNRQNNFTTAHGLANDCVLQIIEDNLGYLLLGTRSGITRVSLLEFSEVAAGSKPAFAAQTFQVEDGMKNEECSSAAPIKTPDGRLWFPTLDGLVIVDPVSLVRIPTPPTVSVEEVRVDGSSIWTSDPIKAFVEKTASTKIVAAAGAHEIEFRFATPDHVAPEKVHFKCWVEGLEREILVPTVERFARFKNIPPGSYRFHVQACNREGVWSAMSTSLAFTVPPLLWQKGWFRGIAGAVGFAVMGFGIVKLERRRTRLKMMEMEREQELNRERARIARDIHDEVGAGLTQVGLLSELAQRDLCEKEHDYLDDIFNKARELTRSLDEIVWAINPANDTLEKLISYLVEFPQDFLSTASVHCRLDVPSALPGIFVPAAVRHQICLAVKETLNNVIKHAAATEVLMRIQWAEGVLRIAIEDNGRGFEQSTRDDPSATGNGLASIEWRMSEIGGKCDRTSRLGEGTRMELSVEIPTTRMQPRKRS